MDIALKNTYDYTLKIDGSGTITGASACSSITTTTTTTSPIICNYYMLSNEGINEVQFTWTDCDDIEQTDKILAGGQPKTVCVKNGAIYGVPNYDTGLVITGPGANCMEISTTTTTTTTV